MRVPKAPPQLLDQPPEQDRGGDQPYDSTYDLQSELTPIAHPEEFAEFIDAISAAADES
ncbi:hypothetical protein ACFYO7_25430 [Nocardia salmonicida]|uniref:hypothetical protein n=1 Tax=Nocardia salmonicida TaxID=53431 RepID=UPI0036CC1988